MKHSLMQKQRWFIKTGLIVANQNRRARENMIVSRPIVNAKKNSVDQTKNTDRCSNQSIEMRYSVPIGFELWLYLWVQLNLPGIALQHVELLHLYTSNAGLAISQKSMKISY